MCTDTRNFRWETKGGYFVFMDRPIPNALEKYHYISPEEISFHIQSDRLSVKYQMQHLRQLKKDTK